MTSLSKKTFEWPVRVYYEDTDAGGIVFYGNYLRYYERARTEWLRSLGIEQTLYRETTGNIFVVRHADIDYIQVAQLDDLLIITAELTEYRRSMFVLQQNVYKQTAKGPLLINSAKITMVTVKQNTEGQFKPVAVPDFIAALLPPLPR
jgi:acyl-CoA thioester hydrolase